jgi:hypothetical protein
MCQIQKVSLLEALDQVVEEALVRVLLSQLVYGKT